jgi:hypothetical protein
VLSEEGALATQKIEGRSLTTTGIELTEGKHYWEVELVSDVGGYVTFIGISKPNLDPKGRFFGQYCTEGWFISNHRLRFFKNGAPNGPGYPAGSVAGPVVAAVQMGDPSVRMLPDAEVPAGY